MIKLRTLLTEISLQGIKPYTTSFNWKVPRHGDGERQEHIIKIHDLVVHFIFEVYDEGDFGLEYEFSYGIHHSDDDYMDYPTLNHGAVAINGQVNYMRLMATVGIALMSFMNKVKPGVIDISGYDDDSEDKKNQKTRIYNALLATHMAEITTAGYTTSDIGGKLYIVRKSNADSTGIIDKSSTLKGNYD